MPMQSEASGKISFKAYVAIISMSLGTFALGTNEFVTAGFLPKIADTYSVSLPTAGWVASSFVLAASVSSPLVAIAAVKWTRKYLLTGLMLTLAAAGTLCALAPNFSDFIGGRILAGIAHAPFISAGSVVSGALVPKESQGFAVSLFFMGLTLSNVIGVPLSTLFGEYTHWQNAFWPIAGLGLLTAISVVSCVPKKLELGASNVKKELKAFKRPAIWAAFLVSAFGYSGMLASHTYFAKMMTNLAGYDSKDISWLTAVYGVGTVLGNMAGGKLADKNLLGSVCGLMVLLSAVLLTFNFVATYKIPATIALFANGFSGFSLIAPLMGYVMSKAPEGPSLAVASNITAFGIGISLGVYLAGLAIKSGYGYQSPNWVGAALTATGLLFVAAGELCCSQKAKATDDAGVHEPLNQDGSSTLVQVGRLSPSTA